MLAQKFPDTLVSLEGTPRFGAPLVLSPLSPPDHDGRVDYPALSEGVPDLPGAPQDEAGLTRKFQT